MLKIFSSAAIGAALVFGGPFDAEALPAARASSEYLTPNITLIAGFCGIRRHRAKDGTCVPNQVVAPPPPVICQPGFHWSTYYRRCVE